MLRREPSRDIARRDPLLCTDSRDKALSARRVESLRETPPPLETREWGRDGARDCGREESLLESLPEAAAGPAAADPGRGAAPHLECVRRRGAARSSVLLLPVAVVPLLLESRRGSLVTSPRTEWWDGGR